MLVGGDYYRATMLSEKIEVLHRFIEDETYKYLVIIDADRGEDILAYLSRIECPIRIVVDVDNLDEAITFKSSSLLTKSIFIRPFICRDTQGIIEECEPLVAFF